MNQAVFVFYRFEHPIKRRHYQIMLSQDLFGDWVITKAWGGINQSSGRIMRQPCETAVIAQHLIEKVIKLREKRGYVLAKKIGDTISIPYF